MTTGIRNTLIGGLVGDGFLQQGLETQDVGYVSFKC